MKSMHKYNRVLVKLSGEALAGEQGKGFDHNIITGVVKQLKKLVDNDIEVSVVIGGGNFWRGRTSGDMDRTKADQVGMLATVMNAIYVADVCRAEGVESVVQTPFAVGSMTELFSKDKALELCLSSLTFLNMVSSAVNGLTVEKEKEEEELVKN